MLRLLPRPTAREHHNMTRNTKIVLAVFGAIVVLAITMTVVSLYQKSHRSTLSVVLSLPLQNISISINGKRPPETATADEIGSGQYYFTVHSGHCSVTVSKKTYKTFTSSLVLRPGQSAQVNVILIPATRPSASDLTKILITAPGSSTPVPLSTQYPPSVATTTQYFENGTWAFVTVNVTGGNGATSFVTHYDSSLGQWVLVTTPSDVINLNTSTPIPQDLKQYVIQSNVANEGSDE
jgi:hypothetical protein